MATRAQKELARRVSRDYGRLLSKELGFDLSKGTASPLFRWMTYSLLASARISHEIALEAAKALARRKWTTARKLQDSTWRQRTDTLNRAGYARYDERTSRMLGDDADMLMERWGGDLRKLREEAGRDPLEERELLKEIKGLGDVGVDIFFREAQLAWDEVFPFADEVALRAARKLGLGSDAQALREHARGREAYVALVAGLARVELEKAHAAVEAG